jgi:hypothetical protein
MICSTWCTYMTMYLYNDMHFKHTCHRSTLVLQATRLTLRYTVATASASLYNNSSKGSKGSSKESRSGGIKRIKRIKWDRVGSSVKDQEGCKGSRGLQGGNRGVLSSMQWTTEHMSSTQWTTVEHAMNMNTCRACNEQLNTYRQAVKKLLSYRAHQQRQERRRAVHLVSGKAKEKFEIQSNAYSL